MLNVIMSVYVKCSNLCLHVIDMVHMLTGNKAWPCWLHKYIEKRQRCRLMHIINSTDVTVMFLQTLHRACIFVTHQAC